MKVGIEEIKIEGLKQFPSIEGLPQTSEEIKLALHSPLVRRIYCFALGPAGTNISQACEEWVESMALHRQTVIELCHTPEESLTRAREIGKEDVFLEAEKTLVGKDEILGIFWTCAVYYNLNKLFFENPDTLPFFIQYTMRLDEMQLATREELIGQVAMANKVPEKWLIASHPSPAPLLPCQEVVLVNSNAVAAAKCREKEVELCITTESARRIHGLVKVHSFGSPPMVFFGGITQEGAQLIKRAFSYEMRRP